MLFVSQNLCNSIQAYIGPTHQLQTPGDGKEAPFTANLYVREKWRPPFFTNNLSEVLSGRGVYGGSGGGFSGTHDASYAIPYPFLKDSNISKEW